MDGHDCVFLTQSEGGEVPHKVHSGLSPPGHQPQGQVVPRGQHRPGGALPTKRRPEGRRAPVPSVVELNVRAGVTRVPRAFAGGGLQSGIERGGATRGFRKERGRTQGGHAEQTVDQEEAEVELDLVFRGVGLHGEVAVGPHDHKVVLLGFLVRVDDHAVTPDRLTAEVHHVRWHGKRDRILRDELTTRSILK